MEETSAPAETAPAPQARPDWAPEKYWDAERGELRARELATAHAELGQRFARGAEELRKTLEPEIRSAIEAERLRARPGEAAAYDAGKLTLPKGLNVLDAPPADRAALRPGERYALIGKDDPWVGWWRETAWKAGLSQEEFAAGVARYADSVAVAVPGEAERKAHRAAILAELGERGQQRVAALFGTLKGWLGDDVAALDEVVQSPAAIVALERIVERAASPRFSPGGTGAPAGSPEKITLERLRAMQRSKDYWHSEELQRQVRDGYRSLYPDRG